MPGNLATLSLSLRGTAACAAGAFARVALDVLSLVSARDAPVSPVAAVDSASDGARGILDDDEAEEEDDEKRCVPSRRIFVGDGM